MIEPFFGIQSSGVYAFQGCNYLDITIQLRRGEGWSYCPQKRNEAEQALSLISQGREKRRKSSEEEDQTVC